MYRIDGGDIYLDLPVAPWEAALGTTVTVSVPSGHIELLVEQGILGPIALKILCIAINRRNQSFWPVLIQRSTVKT